MLNSDDFFVEVFDGVLDQPSDIDFFLDFIDASAAISEFSV